MKKTTSILLCCAMILALLSGCGQSGGYKINKDLAKAESVKLNLTGSTPSFKAMESVIASFCKLYPNCTINYEYVQDYDKSMTTRLKNNDNVDMFITKNITASSDFLPYAMELKGLGDKLNLADTYEGLLRNFTFSEDGADVMYAVPLGGEVRGMYVNTTILKSLNLSVPTNYSELLSCCKTLKDAGYVPLQGNPGSFGQLLMYPYVCSLIANSSDYQGTYDKVNSCASGVSEIFREPVSRLYDMVKNGYYNYKYVEKTYGYFKESTDENSVQSFLGLEKKDDGSYVKTDDVGKVAFMPATMSLKSVLDKAKEDYHSAIEYQFILSPVGDKGGFAYLSPASGIAINKNSPNTAWAVEFMNYLFSKDVNKAFAAEQNIISNTPDALETISSTFSVSSDRVCQLGQVTFKYVFYDVMKKALTTVSKGNNPKYMQKDGTMYDLAHYMEELENGFAEVRTGG
jgi:ABC-type glycerol-3-phosphate transport system substrate-binding protein